MLIRITLCSLFLLLCTATGAQSQNAVPECRWAYSLHSPNTNIIRTVIPDREKNLYVMGNFADTLFTQGDTLVGPFWSPKVFLLKFGPDGRLLWSKAFISGLRNRAMALDSAGNICIIAYDNYPEQNGKVFLLKFNAQGEQVLKSEVGGRSFDIWALASDRYSNIYMLRRLDVTDTIRIRKGEIALGPMLCMSKYDPQGKILWLKKMPVETTYRQNMAVDPGGTIYNCGDLAQETRFGDTLVLRPGEQTWSMYLAGYNTDGSLLWARKIDLTSEAERNEDNYIPERLISDREGNIYLSAYYGKRVRFDDGFTVTDPAFYPMKSPFIARFDRYGNRKFIRTSSHWVIMALATDEEQNIYCYGTRTGGEVAFENGDTLPPQLSSKSALLVRYDSSGTMQWTAGFKGSTYSSALTLAAAGGELFLAGAFMPNVDFGGGWRFEKEWNKYENSYSFIARIQGSGVTSVAESSESPSLNIRQQGSLLVLDLPLPGSAAVITIYTSLGERVYSETLPAGSEGPVTLDTGEFPAGVYLVRIETAKGIFHSKLLVP